MRRFSRVHRSQSWSAMSIDSAPINAGISAGNAINLSRSKSPSPSTRSSVSRRDYDTGFSAPFCGSGNTTLRHPSANTSPDFCISSGDIDVDRVYNRSRRSFLSNKNKRTTLNHGKLGISGVEYNDLSSIVETQASPTRTGTSSGGSIDSNDSSRISKDGRGSFSLQQANTEQSRPTTSHSAVHRGGSVFRKLRI
ncbi:hypothetical protein F503_02248 [Ophiostoma piceae UAMH 11346]|uniref:Uncharacterized protein n=1 Tax=Ophiostoma piceae (strain UAMH 11346) TaxID=1262450 RepID=S3BW73_OPHP1|nr:hypothetical protein F503_02248 [Ophiostoma piceae UAMH 11346]